MMTTDKDTDTGPLFRLTDWPGDNVDGRLQADFPLPGAN